MTTKEKVLTALQKNPTPTSGEKLAQQVGVSRTAIWKAVKELEKLGYNITAGPTGYLLQNSDVLAADVIHQHAPLLQDVIIKTYAEERGTMKMAKLAAIDHEPAPMLVVADREAAPHGRFNRPFFSQSKTGLYMSLLLNPEKSFEELPQYTVLAAVAISQAIDELAGVRTEIKWVNDIYLNGKKICGILSEALSDVESGSIQSIIIGVGLNFTILQADFPADLQAKITSIFPDGPASTTLTRNELVAKIWQNFFQLLQDLPNEDFLTVYREKSFVLGKKVTFTRQGENYSGTAVEIDHLGQLIVDLGTKRMALASGEISLASIG